MAIVAIHAPVSPDVLQEKLAKLREPFPPEQVNKLPRVICRTCSDRKLSCGEHQKAKCSVCKAYISTAHIHLDYVGHAELTARLLDADPLWTWEPFALDETGLPAFDKFGGLWIRLTVAGLTRPGYGDAQGKDGPNAVKEAIGDALRNAGMRFGAALDLWAKSDLHAAEHGEEAGKPIARVRVAEDSGVRGDLMDVLHFDPFTLPADASGLRGVINQARQQLGMSIEEVEADFAEKNGGVTISTAEPKELQAYIGVLNKKSVSA